jgi:hypothetical protein
MSKRHRRSSCWPANIGASVAERAIWRQNRTFRFSTINRCAQKTALRDQTTTAGSSQS